MENDWLGFLYTMLCWALVCECSCCCCWWCPFTAPSLSESWLANLEKRNRKNLFGFFYEIGTLLNLPPVPVEGQSEDLPHDVEVRP